MQALAELKATNQDFEWYPTTEEIIQAFHGHAKKFEVKSLLDIGAGNGKVLNRFSELSKDSKTELFAIEKARPLLDSLPAEIAILGTDFWEQSLLDKKVDCIFSNPPYSEFIGWATKLIKESYSNFIYLVLPQRWKEQKRIMDALASRKAGYKVIGEFDFLNSEDRQARAKVDLIFVWLCDDYYIENPWRHARDVASKADPFEQWVRESFNFNQDTQKPDSEKQKTESRKEKIKHSVVTGRSLIESLESIYLDELGNLLDNYHKISSLDGAIFKELDISISAISSSIRTKINGLKNIYWKELFDNYTPLTTRLTTKSRRSFIDSINSKTNIDFTSSNAYAVTLWAIKNADKYLDNQITGIFEQMVDSANVINYKSNERVFKKNCFRYYDTEEAYTHFKLDYRIVISLHGAAVSAGGYNSYLSRGGLSENAANFIDDIIVNARNLGFDSDDSVDKHNFVRGEKEAFYCTDKKGRRQVLMEVRAYANGNIHIKFNQAFMLALNVEAGRLLGWVHNAQQAASEMEESIDKVSDYFNTAYALKNDSTVTALLTQ